jgi:hypothetical protein
MISQRIACAVSGSEIESREYPYPHNFLQLMQRAFLFSRHDPFPNSTLGKAREMLIDRVHLALNPFCASYVPRISTRMQPCALQGTESNPGSTIGIIEPGFQIFSTERCHRRRKLEEVNQCVSISGTSGSSSITAGI